jgi:prevent-host-death family protein
MVDSSPLDKTNSNLYSILYRLEALVKKRGRLISDPRVSHAAAESASAAKRADKLEETLEFTNLTDFRNSLLNFIPRVQDNEYLRFVITKHGKPVAVVLSYDAYNLLKRVAERVMDEEEKKEPAVALQESYQELLGKPAPVEVPISLVTERDISPLEMKRMRQVVHMALQEYRRTLAKAEKDLKGQEEFLPGDFEKL